VLSSLKRWQCIVCVEESFAENFIHGLSGYMKTVLNLTDMLTFHSVNSVNTIIWLNNERLGYIISYVQENWAKS
jgi:hypothetical protein